MADEVTRLRKRENGRSFCSDSIVAQFSIEESVDWEEGLNDGDRAVTFRRQQLKGSRRPRWPVGLMCSAAKDNQVADSIRCSYFATTHKLTCREREGERTGTLAIGCWWKGVV